MNQQLIAHIRAEIQEARKEGMDEEDVEFMAQGAGIRLAREQGVLGEHDASSAMQAAIALVVKQVLHDE